MTQYIIYQNIPMNDYKLINHLGIVVLCVDVISMSSQSSTYQEAFFFSNTFAVFLSLF